MHGTYQKICVEKNPTYSIYYGAGNYFSNEHHILHYDSDLSITCFKHCSGTIKIEGKHYAISSGDAIIMNPNEIHCCSIHEGTFHERISLCIDRNILKIFPYDGDAMLDCFLKRDSGVGNVIPAKTVEKYNIGNLLETILSLSKQETKTHKILSICKIIELLAQLNNAVSQHADVIVENQTIAEVIAYIAAHFTEDISCAQIAESFFISKFRLEHLFKECVGISLWDYVLLRRLIFFNDLVQKGGAVKESSYAAGFRNYSNFYRLYKKHMNQTPLEYKKMHKTQPARESL